MEDSYCFAPAAAFERRERMKYVVVTTNVTFAAGEGVAGLRWPASYVKTTYSLSYSFG